MKTSSAPSQKNGRNSAFPAPASLFGNSRSTATDKICDKSRPIVARHQVGGLFVRTIGLFALAAALSLCEPAWAQNIPAPGTVPPDGNAAAASAPSDLDKAISLYSDAIKRNPDDANALEARGNAYMQEKHFDQAISDYSQVIRLKPHYTTAYLNRATAYRLNEHYANATPDHSQQLQSSPVSYTHLTLPTIYSV